jgi:hypothetical protein
MARRKQIAVFVTLRSELLYQIQRIQKRRLPRPVPSQDKLPSLSLELELLEAPEIVDIQPRQHLPKFYTARTVQSAVQS